MVGNEVVGPPLDLPAWTREELDAMRKTAVVLANSTVTLGKIRAARLAREQAKAGSSRGK